MLAIHGKSLFIGHDLMMHVKHLIPLLASGNIIYVYISLAGQDTIRKGRVDKNNVTKLDLNNNKNREYEIEAI